MLCFFFQTSIIKSKLCDICKNIFACLFSVQCIFLLVCFEIDCSNCEAVYFGESKRSLKSRSNEHKRSVRNCDCDKNEIAKHCWEADHNFNWDQKKVVDRESRLIPRKIKETIHSLKNPNHINKISYMLPEIWLPNLR